MKHLKSNPYIVISIIYGLLTIATFGLTALCVLITKLVSAIVLGIITLLLAIVTGINTEKTISEYYFAQYLDHLKFIKIPIDNQPNPFKEFDGEVPFPEVKNKKDL